jgi:hypothetical protein
MQEFFGQLFAAEFEPTGLQGLLDSRNTVFADLRGLVDDFSELP